jgi:YtxH-like protein
MIEAEVSYHEFPAGAEEPVESSFGSLLGAFALGAAAGAALALLFAPSSGHETRDAIAERVHALSERIRATRRRMMRQMRIEVGAGDLPAGVWPGTPSQADNGTDYESMEPEGGSEKGSGRHS